MLFFGEMTLDQECLASAVLLILSRGIFTGGYTPAGYD